jgi:hypothetical protein
MAQLTLTIPDEKLAIVRDALWGLYPVPRDADNAPIYTKAQWARIAVIELIKRDVHRWRLMDAEQTAKNNIIYDNEVIS